MSDPVVITETPPEQKPTDQQQPTGGMVNRANATDSQINQDINAWINIPEAKLTEITNWFIDEVEIAKRDRSDLDAKLVEWERLYEARPKVTRKTEPWPDASNLVVPVIATAVDAVLARMLNAVFGGKRLWLGQAMSPNWIDLVDPLSHWLNWVGSRVMDMYRVCQRWFLSTIKYGTGIVKLPWTRRVRNVIYKDQGGAETFETVVLHYGPEPEVVPLPNFFFSADALTTGDIQTCEWLCHESFLTWKKLKEMEASEIFIDVDRIKVFKRTTPTDMEEEKQRNVGITPTEYNDYRLWEGWISYDVNDDGILEEILLTVEPESRVAIRGVYNFYRHQERPFHLIRYMPRDNDLLGIGICQMLQDIQEEVTVIHNQRLDNATLANTRAWKHRRNSLVGDDEIYPGAFIEVDEMDSLEELKMGDIYPSMLAEEMHTNSIGEKRTGVSDYTVGRESAAIGSRATATSTMALLREGNKRFQMTIKDIREALADIAHQVIMLYQQSSPSGEVMYELFSEKDGRIVQEFFNLPYDYTRTSVLIDTPALSETNNKEVAQQTMLTLMGVVKNFYDGMFQAFSMAIQPGVPEPLKGLAIQGAKAGAEIWERVLEAFDFRDAENFVPDIEMLLGMQANQDMLGGLNGQPTNVGTPEGTNGGQPPGAGLGGLEQLMASAVQGAQGAPGGLPAQAGGAPGQL